MTTRLIAVTGASGFIGGHLLTALADNGFRVRAQTRRPPPSSDDTVSWVRGSLADAAALSELVSGADVVVHLAGAIKAVTRADYFAHNVYGTRALVGALLGLGNSPRLVHVSSLAAREPGLSDYAASKRASEQVVLSAAGRLPSVVLRPSAVYGPGDRETLPIFKMASMGWVAVPALPGARLSLIHVADLVAAIVASIDAPLADLGPIEIDDGMPDGYRWTEIAAAAAEAVRREARIVPVPLPLIYLAGLAGTAFSRLSGRPSQVTWSKAAEIGHPDWRARRQAIPGFQPRWSMANGFKDTVNWAISQGLLKSYS
jgi:nucleoside-diphosphate-sugar epimerase